ncbi:SMP-30/gluconolactonase/LRE family protein [Ruegeria sediminis]|uniref:SMP-30/gluconolactonase/LRE family protein n=1 Tax=Ruegeria sediminis TaxID=2583820 RepID=A0ABY2WT88_9RHOB|nr:SMP-30/gluconolactonase/LRE family protein [Ruegeria sediminis]TMV04286.1 SMP-30/gluconolactonase/LRE family protein [Ruegeria sediminis]
MTGLSYVGRGLRRPESVLATASGDIYCSHNGHGVARIRPDGAQLLLAPATQIGGLPIVPNGIALRPDGSFLVANISDAGGSLELDADGVRLFHPCTDGETSPPVNFVALDEMGRIWITVSSTYSPRCLAYNKHTANGYVAMIEGGKFRVVLEGLAYTNEVRPDYEGGWLYIAETMAQRISRVRLDEKGLHGAPEVFAQLPRGAFLDGMEIDSEGGVLAACIISSELIRIDPDGGQTVIMGERMDAWVNQVEDAFDAGDMGRHHLDTSPTTGLRNIASLAYHGANLDQIVCGNLLDDKLPCTAATVPGRTPVHWHTEVPFWGDAF